MLDSEISSDGQVEFDKPNYDSAYVTTLGLVVHSVADGVALGCSLFCKFKLFVFDHNFMICSQ